MRSLAPACEALRPHAKPCAHISSSARVVRFDRVYVVVQDLRPTTASRRADPPTVLEGSGQQTGPPGAAWRGLEHIAQNSRSQRGTKRMRPPESTQGRIRRPRPTTPGMKWRAPDRRLPAGNGLRRFSFDKQQAESVGGSGKARPVALGGRPAPGCGAPWGASDVARDPSVCPVR